MATLLRPGLTLLAVLGALAAPGCGMRTTATDVPAPASAVSAPEAVPEWLSETGLYVAGTTQVREDILPFVPQYPLWSDGADKRRWIYLPPGTVIDAAEPDAWEFPPGTKLWKEFGHARPIETRLIERLADGTWRYVTYIWNAQGSDALLAPAKGIAALPVAAAPGGRYVILSHEDCRACHEGTAVPVLGMTPLQLSPDRDPRAPNGEPKLPEHVDLPGLAARGLLRNLPPAMLEAPPRIAVDSPTTRAALGYLHANCGHCHNDQGPLSDVELMLAQTSAGGGGADKVLRSIVEHPTETRAFGLTVRVVPGQPQDSQLAARMRSRNPLTQMPPLATTLVDTEGTALIEQWIQQLLTPEEQRQ